MRLLLIVAVTAAVGGATVASAQTGGSIDSAPSNGTTGPTFPSTRSIDQSIATTPSGNAAAPSNTASTIPGNGRRSGLNAEPDQNNNGVPSPASGSGTTR
jgi:hypothetical protein